MTEVLQIHDNAAQSRFEIVREDEVLGEAVYRRQGNVVSIVHTGVSPAHSGQGIGSALAQGALEAIRANGEKVEPTCPFIADFIVKHPEFAELLA